VTVGTWLRCRFDINMKRGYFVKRLIPVTTALCRCFPGGCFFENA